MGCVRRELVIAAPADEVWARLREPARAAEAFPGVLTRSRMAGERERLVTFSNGVEVRERIVDLDHQARRIAYAASGFDHHNASMELTALGESSTRFVWITDFLPDEARPSFEPLIDAGVRSFASHWAS